jgi:GntR family transcriptional repressor for pyruvate dehydrogenase complex
MYSRANILSRENSILQQTEITSYFEPYKSKRSFEEISNQIKRLIFQGVLKPGDKLPPEAKIANQFNVSRQTIREAMRILEHCGFITIQQGVNGGPLIVDTILNRLATFFIDIFHFKKVTPNELTEARFDIEKVMLKHVIERADDSDLEALRENVRTAKEKVKTSTSPFAENIEFHKILARASKNYIYIIVIESIMALVADFRSEVEEVDFKRSRKITKYHEDVVEAIIERNLEWCIYLFEKLLGEVRAVMMGK